MSATVDLRERQYVSQWATDALGLTIMRAGRATDVDANEVTVTVIDEAEGTTLFTRLADHVGIGVYQTTLSSEETATPGLYTVVWTYALLSTAQEYRTYIEIGQANPAYDALSLDMKDLVDTCWVRFADAFDSPGGGPNLTTYFQTHFNRGRLAELLRVAVGTLNTVAQPFQTYTIDGVGGAAFPVAKWGALLERSLYIETLKHLIRSYVEQPMFVGGSVTRLDRRDYMERWQAMLGIEQPIFERQLQTFKIANMGMGKPAVLVSGGVYGRYGPTRIAGSVAARPRMWTRWY